MKNSNRRSASSIKRGFKRLHEIAPNLINKKNPKPFKIGILDELLALNGDEPRKPLRNAMALWCVNRKYINAIAKDGSMRHDVNGEPIEPVSEKDRASAREKLLEIDAKTEARNAKAAKEQEAKPEVKAKAEHESKAKPEIKAEPKPEPKQEEPKADSRAKLSMSIKRKPKATSGAVVRVKRSIKIGDAEKTEKAEQPKVVVKPARKKLTINRKK